VRVEVAAARLGLLCDVAYAPLLRALEEHVLQGVSETVLVVRLVEVTRLDVRHDRDDGRGPVFLDEDG